MADAAKQERDEEIRKQCDFYFGDANLPLDKHLLTLVNGSENKPVPIKEICSFKKMAKYQYEDVVSALRTGDTFTVTDDEQMARKVPLDAKWTLDVARNRDIFEDDNQPRSLYVSGFPRELEQDANAQRVLEEFFAPYGPIAVRMMRTGKPHQPRVFTGGVTVIFTTEDEAKQLLELDEKPVFQDQHKLKFSTKQTPSELRKEREAREQQKGGDRNGKTGNKKDHKAGRGGRGGRGGGRGGRGGRGERRSTRRREGGEEGDEEEGADEAKGEFKGDKDNWRDRRNHDQGRKRQRDDGEEGGAEGGEDAAARETKRAREENGESANGAQEKGVQSDAKVEAKETADGGAAEKAQPDGKGKSEAAAEGGS